MKDLKAITQRIKELSEELLKHQRLYYVEANPRISDLEYDRLFNELLILEKKYPDLADINSPTKRVGSDLSNDFADYEHKIPVLSLDKVYNTEYLKEWMKKRSVEANRNLDFILEEKFDGASIVLYYKKGELEAAVTRGNGRVGNVVTENIRTIKEIPLKLKENINLSVRGEIYLTKSDFLKLRDKMSKEYANPRNLAAGTLRSVNSNAVAQVPLKMAVYEGNFPLSVTDTHMGALIKLRDLGFKTEPGLCLFSPHPKKMNYPKDIPIYGLDQVENVIQKKEEVRNTLAYEIDGLVFKVNSLDARGEIGLTFHHPKWAVAFKFESPVAQSVVLSMVIQVGRNGRVTPVANLKPVQLAGSVISRATLHNQDYIDLLELNIGDKVEISKRGDIIPAVERVIEKGSSKDPIYKIEAPCPFCSTGFIKNGAHLFCPNSNCPERKKRQIIHFCRRDCMDIETMGEKTITFLYDQGLIRDIPDIYTFGYSKLLEYEGFKEKKVLNILNSLDKSKHQPFSRVLLALGFENLGKKAVEILIKNGFNTMDRLLSIARKQDIAAITVIDGIGEHTASLIIKQLSDPLNLQKINQLREIGLNFSQEIREIKGENLMFNGQSWAITGSFEKFQPREKAGDLIKKLGGKIKLSVTPKTTYLLMGKNPGSKFIKARQLKIPIVDEQEFLSMIRQKGR